MAEEIRLNREVCAVDRALRRNIAAGWFLPAPETPFDLKGRGEHILLIIEESSLPRSRRSARYLSALIGLFPAKDVVVWTPDEAAQWANVPHAFITAALRGKGPV